MSAETPDVRLRGQFAAESALVTLEYGRLHARALALAKARIQAVCGGLDLDFVSDGRDYALYPGGTAPPLAAVAWKTPPTLYACGGTAHAPGNPDVDEAVRWFYSVYSYWPESRCSMDTNQTWESAPL